MVRSNSLNHYNALVSILDILTKALIRFRAGLSQPTLGLHYIMNTRAGYLEAVVFSAPISRSDRLATVPSLDFSEMGLRGSTDKVRRTDYLLKY